MDSTSITQKIRAIAFVCFVGSVLGFIYYYATTPIADPDFWWHLKTGELMAQKGGLLQADPFTFTGDGVVSSREKIILTGYWLWQSIAFYLYSQTGFNGIFFLNFIVISATIGVIAYQMRSQRISLTIACPLLVIGLIPFHDTHMLERPQIVSFLFATLLLGFLSKIRDDGRLGWTLPLLMAFWANIHGGFLVGDLILFCFATGVLYEYRKDLSRARQLLIWVAVGIAASLLSPNSWRVFGEILSFSGSELQTGVNEYLSTWIKFKSGDWSMGLLWLLIALYGIGTGISRRLYLPELLTALFLALFSAVYVRNVGFFALPMLPVIAYHLQQGAQRHSRRISPLASALVLVAAMSSLLWQTNILRDAHAGKSDISTFYPKKSSDFILASELQGRMFNSYTYGGYQLWRLYPQHQVFIDGRGMDTEVYNDYILITSVSSEKVDGRKEYEVLLDRYQIDYVVQPIIFPDTGRLTPLQKRLLLKPDWTPVYLDEKTYILIRDTEKNSTVIKRHRIDKRLFVNKVADHLRSFAQSSPTDVKFQIGLTEMLIYIGRYAEAEKHLAIIEKLAPGHPEMASLQNQLEVLRGGKKR